MPYDEIRYIIIIMYNKIHTNYNYNVRCRTMPYDEIRCNIWCYTIKFILFGHFTRKKSNSLKILSFCVIIVRRIPSYLVEFSYISSKSSVKDRMRDWEDREWKWNEFICSKWYLCPKLGKKSILDIFKIWGLISIFC